MNTACELSLRTWMSLITAILRRGVPHTEPAGAANIRRAPAAATAIDPMRKCFRVRLMMVSSW